jgi:hypothetical protein
MGKAQSRVSNFIDLAKSVKFSKISHMRKCMILLILLCSYYSYSQNGGLGAPSDLRNTRMIARSSLGPVIEHENLRKKFINQQWSPGIVMFSNSPVRYPAQLIFDEFNNKLYFLKDEHIMEYTQPVKEFVMMLVQEGDSTYLTFRNAYPAVNKNTGETYYQVIVDGKYQLLKCTAKTNLLYKDEELPEEKRNPIKEMLYAVTPDNQIVEIKKDREYQLSKVSGYATTIQKVLEENKLKLNKEKSLIKLFELLNELK